LANGSLPSQGFVPVDVAKSPKTGEDFVKEAGSDKLVKYDKKKAVEYWNKAKQELGVSNLTVDLMVDDSEGAKKMGEYLQGSLSDTLEGLKVTVTPVPMAVRLDRTLKGDFQIAVRGWSADYSDPINFLDLLESSTSNNRGRYSNPEYDKFIAASKTTDVNDPEKRWEDLINAEKTVIADMGVVPIYQKAESHLRAPNVKEIIYHPTGAKYDFKWAYKE
ncbi:MAG: ABC transporter substrate-binding protein, partial [Enterococcus faecalis]|nr:ABC transporter substrate-binding protein [Enterococcus faecalis]